MVSNYRNIGKLVSVFGLKGELIIHHHLGKKTSLKGLEVIFIEDKKDEMLPYFIQSAKIKTEQELFLKLEGIDSKENARKLLQKEVWLTEADFLKYAGKTAPISLVGYHMIDQGKDLGEILEVIEQPYQVLCRLQMQQKEVLIPVNEETLKKTDQKNKKVFVSLPEGLLDIYLA
ncbi:MAG TPA: ribosome maturation factor RimM [Puia sp.]|nr:ribosome maturation factor RimM [Puia sp.]